MKTVDLAGFTYKFTRESLKEREESNEIVYIYSCGQGTPSIAWENQNQAKHQHIKWYECLFYQFFLFNQQITLYRYILIQRIQILTFNRFKYGFSLKISVVQFFHLQWPLKKKKKQIQHLNDVDGISVASVFE